MESGSAITNTFHKVVEKRNPYQNKVDANPPNDASVIFFSGVQHIISFRDGEGKCQELRMRLQHMECEKIK
jgi:hypothetical protein